MGMEFSPQRKKMKKGVDTQRAPAYTNVTGDAHRGAPMTVL
jgi:hypothetical protein